MTVPQAPRVYAAVRCLRFAALGADLAAEAVNIGEVIRISAVHAVTRHEPGYVMLHEGSVIPLADYRGPESRHRHMAGAPALIARVYRRQFALVVDRVEGRLDVECAEIAPPADALACRFPYLTGRISRGGADIYLIDVERLLGPAIEKHLLERR